MSNAQLQPTTYGLLLGRRLRQLRTEAGVTLEEAAEALGCHHSKVSRIENGKQHVFDDDVSLLLPKYGRPELVDAFQTLARDAMNANRVRHSFATLDQKYADLIAVETTAESVHVYAPEVVPGLLQTAAYSHLITAGVMPTKTEQAIADLVEVRQHRQAILTRADRPLVYWTIIDESVLRRAFPGQPEVMREQLERLLDAAGKSNVTVQVMPLHAKPHPGVAGGFDVIRFAPPMPDIIKLETLKGSSHLYDPDDVALWEAAWSEIAMAALPVSDSLAFIERLRGGAHHEQLSVCHTAVSGGSVHP